MNVRPFLRPLPLIVMLLFAAVAGVDLMHSLRQEPPPLPRLLRPEAVRFVMREPVLDLREAGDGNRPDVVPAVHYEASWSSPVRGGRWLLGGLAELVMEGAGSGYRTVAVEARAAARMPGPQQVAVSVNGRRCGVMEFGHEWRWRALTIPDGVIASGDTTVVLELGEQPQAAVQRRRLLVRRLGFFRDREIETSTLSGLAPAMLDVQSDRLSLGTSGVFEVGFQMDGRVDALKLRYRFSSAQGSAEVVVRRPEGGGAGRDAPDRSRLVAADGRTGRIRFPLHGRRGEFVFRVEVDPGPPPARLDLLGVQLVSEQRSSGQADSRRP